MFRANVFMGVLFGFIGFISVFIVFFLIMAVSPGVLSKLKKNDGSNTIGCGIPLIVALVISVVVGIGASLSMADYLKKGDYSDHECFTCKEPASYKVKDEMSPVIYYYCEKHYDDAVYQYSGRREEAKARKANQHPCAICGKTEGTRQINNNKIGGKWDESWYCQKHYADAWQYYYGN